MGGWLRQLALGAQVRAGVSTAVVVWAALAALALALAFVFLLIAAFVWLADRYDPTIAGVVLGGFFVLVALIAIIACVVARRGNIRRARFELELRKNASANAGLLDPRLIATGLQLAQSVGWRRLASLAAVAILAAALAREWFGREQKEEEGQERSKSSSEP
jgi:hypothetical protein